MGRVKAWINEQDAQGFDSRSTFVCTNCIDDDALIAFIKKNGAREEPCSYCEENARGKKSIAFDELMKEILKGLYSEWGDPNDEGVPWEQGWVGDVIDTYDIFHDELSLGFSSESLRNNLIDSLSDHQWCQRNFYELEPHKALSAGWNEFENVVKHVTRYVFLRCEDKDAWGRGGEEIPPAQFLDALGSVISTCKLYTALKTGTELFRIRMHETDQGFETAQELGAPPTKAAKYPNRMSAAGIPAFYGAFDQETAIAETYTPTGNFKWATVGKFAAHRDLTVVDLSKIPSIPSIFEPNSRWKRHGLIFLRHFLRDFTAPIEKDGREHIDYVPTQIVAEYLRFVHRMKKDTPIDGIVYPSSRNQGSNACILFIGSEHSTDPGAEDDDTALVLTKVETFSVVKSRKTAKRPR